MNLLSLQYKILFIAIITLIGGLVALWFLGNKMTTQKGSINVTKMTHEDRIYSYSVFGDFYFRVIEFDANGEKKSHYSELIPVVANIGYDFKQTPAQPIISPQDENKVILLNQIKGDKLSSDASKFINKLHEFSSTYIQIIATQDEHYLNEATKIAEKINREFFKDYLKLKLIKKDSFYDGVYKTPINNLQLEVFKLDTIDKNLQSFELCANEWCPDIAKWSFNENDQIYIQLLDKVSHSELDDFMLQEKIKDSLLIKTIKPTKKGLESLFFEVNLAHNRVMSYFMDPNGYVYMIMFRAQNKSSLYENLSEYLKIVYSLVLVDAKNFDNKFSSIQQEVIDSAKKIVTNYSDVKKLIGSINDDSRLQELFSNSLDETEKKLYDALLRMELSQTYSYEDFYKYKNTVGVYPNKEMVSTAENLKNKLSEFNDVVKKAKSMISGGMIGTFMNKIIISGDDPIGDDPINEICKKCDNLECIQKMNENKGWTK